MKRLENLKEITDRNLAGLKADTRLLHQILHAKTPKAEKKIKWRPVLIAGAAAVALLCAGLFGLPQLLRYNGDMEVVTRSAGGELAEQTFQLTANVPAGSVSISESAGNMPGYRSLFAPEQNANFPLLKVGNATYRLLKDSVSISAERLGEQLGNVTEFTDEPAVSAGGIVSNIIAAGQPVYAVKGMKAAAVAADIQGTLRVFQRVSFGSTAIVGSETLKDVLTGSAQVVSLELSDVGRIDQADAVQTIMDTLFRYAHYEGAAESANSRQSLLLKLNNGITVQMNAGNGTLSACGTWSCPEFFEAFADAVSE